MIEARTLPQRLRYLSALLDEPIGRAAGRDSQVTLIGVKLALEMTADELDAWLVPGAAVGDGAGGAGGEGTPADHPAGELHAAAD